MKKKSKVPLTMVMSPEGKKRAQKTAKKLDVSLSVLSEAALKRLSDEHDFIKESAELQGKTPEELEIEFIKFWGLE